MLLHVWLLSFSLMFPRFIHAVACQNAYDVYGDVASSCMGHVSFISSLVGIHLSCCPHQCPLSCGFNLHFFLWVTSVSMFSYVHWTSYSLFGNPSVWILSPVSNWLVLFWLSYSTIRPVLRCGLRNCFQSFKILFPTLPRSLWSTKSSSTYTDQLATLNNSQP